MSDPEDFIEEDDLFGDDDGEAPVRQLSDEDLDSGDDEGRDDRAQDHMEVDAAPQREARVMDLELGRQTMPAPADGEIHTFRLPKFVGLDPMPFDNATFQIPEYDHHLKSKTRDFSAAAVADTTIRYRKNPANGKLEGNAYISQWSDGTATLHVGANDYELLGKPLAPSMKEGKEYKESQDSHQYLVTAHGATQILQTVGHITNQYTVMPNRDMEDAALTRLTSALKATKRARLNLSGDKDAGIAIITQTQDPELQKKEAEAAEREHNKLQRRREAAASKAEYSTSRMRSGMSGGLSLDDLEGRSGRTPGSARKKRAAPSGPKRARKSRNDYSSEEDDRPGRHREDEYDLEDDFLAASDEEEEGEESEEDIDDGIMESPKPKKQKTAKASSDEDADADGEPDEDAARESVPAVGEGGRRKRMVIEDDEDDE